MSTVGDVMTAVEVGAKVLPAIISWIQDMIAAGKSGEEAEAIVRRDIKSRRAEYQAAKAADMAALDAKHAGERETQPPENPYTEGDK